MGQLASPAAGIARWLPTVKRLHAANALHGMFLGDELLLQGLPLSNLSALADLIRADFPRDADKKFLIYENDACECSNDRL